MRSWLKKRRRLHIGSGENRLPGWINLDIRLFAGVDVVADVTDGLPVSHVDAVYAEHFLEHLSLDCVLELLCEVQRVLAPRGHLRLTTPNLDWVWATHYRLEATVEEKVAMALAMNRAFHGWEHKFLWNRETLALVLETVGFQEVRWYHYGESASPLFRGIESHETYGDSEELPHVLVVEARPGRRRPESTRALRARFQQEFLDHVAAY